MSLDFFAPYRPLYHPNAHPKLPWWRNNHQSQGNITRWTRADNTWEVSVDTMIIGDITVRHLNLDPFEDEEAVERIRTEFGWGSPPSYLLPPAAYAGLHREPAVIARIPLSNDRFAARPGIHPCSPEGYSQMAPWGTGPGGGMTYADVRAFVDALLLDFDRRLPLPRPPVWPGQLVLVGDLEMPPDRAKQVFATAEDADALDMDHVQAVLYGPTFYGRDVPWLHPLLLPESL